MRILRVLLALLLAAGPTQAQPVVDLLTRYSIPADEPAASAPEGDAPPGSGKRLAALEADLALVSEGLEAFAHPQDADKALLAAKPRLPAGTAAFFRDRASALDSLYRTLAVVDYTWALRFPDPPCAPAAKRSALLRSTDGLFMDPVSGKTSAWMAALLGPNAKGKDLESALDQASASAAPSQAEYARLRARQNLITKALAAEGAVGSARARLYCKRAETRVKLAAANRVTGPVLAARSSGEEVSRRGLVILAGRTSEGLEARGAGVAIETAAGIRVLSDRRLGSGEVAALLDGKTAPVPLSVEREDERSGLMLLRPDGDLGEALTLAETAPKKNDLVFAFAHSERLGAWTKTQGLVTSAGPDQFLTDAVADASMTGGAVLDEEGNVAGLLVLRRAKGGAGEWPAAVPAPALWTWLAGGPAPDAVPVSLSDAGTTKILTASRPLLESLAAGQGAIAASAHDIYTPTPWGTVRGVCKANCEDSSPSSSYSDNGSAELGQAVGKLLAIGAEALIFKGIPALFRGIGSLFKSKPRNYDARSSPAVPTQNTPKEETPKLPDPVLTLTVTTEKTDEAVIFTARITANRDDLKLDGIIVDFAVNQTTAAWAATDASGVAVLTVNTPRSLAAHKSLDEESAKHPWMTNASRGFTKQGVCEVTLWGAALSGGAVGVAVSLRAAPVAVLTAAGAVVKAPKPEVVRACKIIAGVTAAVAAAACKAMLDEEPSKGATPAPAPASPRRLPPQRAKADAVDPAREANDLVRANMNFEQDELRMAEQEHGAKEAASHDLALKGGAAGTPPDPDDDEEWKSRETSDTQKITQEQRSRINRVLEKIGRNEKHDFPRRDGTVYKNRGPGELPSKTDSEYYREYTVKTPDGARGQERLVIGKGGETYFSPDHYKNFIRIP